MNDPVDASINAAPAPTCYLCGSPGKFLYRHLSDRLFGAPGSWNFKQCVRPGCGLAWLDPMPSQEDIAKAYQNYFTHQGPEDQGSKREHNLLTRAYCLVRDGYLAQRFGYATARSSWQRASGYFLYLLAIRRARVHRRVMGLRAQPGGRLLDIGCGNGRIMTRLRNLGWQVEGLEVDAAAVAQARAAGLQVRRGSLENQPYPPAHFDVIIMNHVIEHVHDPAGLLRLCHQILAPGGLLVAITPNLESLGHRVFRHAWRGLEPPRHVFLYTAKSLPALAGSSGFATRSLSTSPLLASFIFQASRALAATGRPRPGSALPPGEWLMAGSFCWLEWARLKFNPNLGEELVFVGEKLRA
jgi:SAM-dependent methyltransferase